MNNVVTELYAVLLNSDLADMADKPESIERDAALSMTLGEQGHRPPWPRAAGEAAAWQIQQIGKLLRQAEVLVISPAAHAAVMAAAATLEPADVSALDRDRDILVPTGLLVLPEPVMVVNRTGSLSDTRAFGWRFITQHQIPPTAQYPGVRVTTFMDRDGPVQPTGWRQAVSQARASGSPLPPLIPDGMYGMRGDACLAEESPEMLANLSEHLRARLLRAARGPGRPVPERRLPSYKELGQRSGEVLAHSTIGHLITRKTGCHTRQFVIAFARACEMTGPHQRGAQHTTRDAGEPGVRLRCYLDPRQPLSPATPDEALTPVSAAASQ